MKIFLSVNLNFQIFTILKSVLRFCVAVDLSIISEKIQDRRGDTAVLIDFLIEYFYKRVELCLPLVDM